MALRGKQDEEKKEKRQHGWSRRWWNDLTAGLGIKYNDWIFIV